MKTLEMMVYNYIRTEILERVPLHPGQHMLSGEIYRNRPDRANRKDSGITRAQRNGYMGLLRHEGSIRQHLSRGIKRALIDTQIEHKSRMHTKRGPMTLDAGLF